jgi:nitrogenase subunit NifH
MLDTPLLARIPRDNDIGKWERENKTVIEGDRDAAVSRVFMALADRIMGEEGGHGRG